MATKTRPFQIQSAGQGKFDVPSENSPSVYTVDLVSESCSCPDFTHRRQTCKHQRAARLYSFRTAIAAAKELSLPTLQRHARRVDLRPEVVCGIQIVLEAAEYEAEAVRPVKKAA